MQIQTPAMAQTRQIYTPIKKSVDKPTKIVAYWFKDADGRLFRRWIPESKF